MKKITFCLFSSLIVFASNAVIAGNHARVIIPGQECMKFFRMPEGIRAGEDYMPNTVIVKVKQELRQQCSVDKIDMPALNAYLSSIGTQIIRKVFPLHAPPAEKQNSLGQELADLSLIYVFTYAADLPMEKVMNRILSFQYFEWVDLWVIAKSDAVCNPNDPSLGSQYHLQGNVTGSINVRNTAWCITNGSPSVVIGITDTGIQLNHPDLQANIVSPLPAGCDVAMNDNNPSWQGDAHGVHVSGCAAAVNNNNTQVSSPAWSCKILPVKIADASGQLVAGYTGIVFAADSGAKIINCSWGSAVGGPFGQNIIDYAILNRNCVIFASAGNDGTESLQYPSSYNRVYRVAGTTSSDSRMSLTSYGYDVDICAPGNNILSTYSSSGTATLSGTSMSSPIAAGAAGLVQSYYNYPNAIQIGEKLKQTCDSLTGVAASTQTHFTQGKLGKGRVDCNNALTQPAKSVIADPIVVTDGNDNAFMPGETLSLTGTFISYLDSTTSATTATLTAVIGASNISITDGSSILGAIATLDTTNNNSDPFTVMVSASAALNARIVFRLRITDSGMICDQYFEVYVNVDYVNIVINDVHTSITSRGLTGYNAPNQSLGLGFTYQLPNPAENLLYEMSLMIGTSSTKVSDMFRDGATTSTDLVSMVRATVVTPSVVSDFDVAGKFNDAGAGANAIPVEISHRAYAWSNSPYRKFVILRYAIKNTGTSTLNNLYAGIVSDWDVQEFDYNKAAYDAFWKMGYVWETNPGGLYAGIKLLTSGTAVHYALDNITGGGGGVDPTTDFLTAEKYTVLSTNRATAGGTGTGNDVIDCVSSGPHSIASGDSIIVAFALIAGDDLTDLQNNACRAQEKWDNTGPCSISTGIDETMGNNFDIQVYPSATGAELTVQSSPVGSQQEKFKVQSIEIINLTGEKVLAYQPDAYSHVHTINVSALPGGIYFVKVKRGAGIAVAKFVKQ